MEEVRVEWRDEVLESDESSRARSEWRRSTTKAIHGKKEGARRGRVGMLQVALHRQ